MKLILLVSDKGLHFLGDAPSEEQRRISLFQRRCSESGRLTFSPVPILIHRAPRRRRAGGARR
jgi:hypothetical protein